MGRFHSSVAGRVTARRGGGRSWALFPWVVGALLALTPSCDDGIDVERQAGPKGTLGDDIYGLMCDRLGASVLAEDLTGESYHSICHYDSAGVYGDAVSQSVLPPVSGQNASRARELSVAKMEAMAQRRRELVRAFNAAFPDIDVADPSSDNPTDTVRLHRALLRFSQDITALYESNPYEPGSAPLMPMATDAIGEIFQALEQNTAARAALMRIAGRQGYRPYNMVMGAVRTLLAYPEMRPFVRAQLEVLGGPDGSASAQLQQLLEVVKRELLSTVPTVQPQAPFHLVDVDAAQPNRPRSALEVGAALLLDEHPDYLGLSTDPPRWVTRRDGRGFAVPAGSQPGVPGSVPLPFVDANGDGFADVDLLGRFVDQGNNPLGLSTPFWMAGTSQIPVDPTSPQPGAPYQYINTSETALAAVARDLRSLVDFTKIAAEGDPAPWQVEHETLMYALAGMQILAGPREPAVFDHAAEAILPASEIDTCPISGFVNPITGEVLPCTSYDRFVGEESPIPDLVHAAGQLLAHPDSDVVILGLLELVENHTEVVARLMGAALRVKEIADQHDELAAQGSEPLAELAHEVPVWDEMAQIVSDMAQHPGLIAKLLGAMADPVMVQSHTQDPKITGAPAQHFGETLSAFMRYRDKFTYDQTDINGPAINATDGWPSYANPHNEVDRKQALNGDNRSMFERSAQLIYDGNQVRACNKEGAKVFTGIGDLYWPLVGSYTECELFTFENIGAFYLDAQMATNHPKRSELVIKDGALEALLNFIGGFTSKDAFLESSSGISGMTLHPTPQGLNRLMFYGSMSQQYGQMPDYDAVNAGSNTDKFVENSIEPLAGAVCPPNGIDVHHCSNGAMQDVLRMRDGATIFGWERLGFYQYLRPQVQVFAELSCNASVTQCDVGDYTGENYFLDLISTLWRHWPDMDHGSYCDHSTTKSDPRYCSGAGINHYEPILADALATDLLPAMHAFAQVASQVNVTYRRGPKAGTEINGTEIVELLVKILFDQSYAASAGIRDRQGNQVTTWVDGTSQPQVTPYTMFADALHRMDLAFDQSADPNAAERKARWKRARSQLVDQFLLVDGEGASARFHNPATPRTLAAGLRVLREQLNANCPDRETSGKCSWASQELGRKMSDVFSRPVFAAVQDLTDQLNQDEEARRELEKFLSYALLNVSSSEALFGMLASLTDLLQLLPADSDFAPIFNAVAVLAKPRDDADGPGAADRTLQVLKAMSSDQYDRYHVLDYVLPALVTPMDNGAGPTPLEVIVDAVADIHRADPRMSAMAEGQPYTPLDEQDYLFVMKTIREFFTSDTRGFRQLYYIVQNRPKD